MTDYGLISCHCGAQSHEVELLDYPGSGEVTMCHCNTCRWTTGALYTSHIPIARAPVSLRGTTAYEPGDERTWLFCSTCGCHVFRTRVLDGVEMWDVSTGVLTASKAAGDDSGVHAVRHLGAEETRDGGLTRWLRPGEPTPDTPRRHPSAFLPARCHCGTVDFCITRPSAASRLPSSPFPDLMLPYVSTGHAAISNPRDEKWWLRDGDTTYLAGTCACRSCRTTLGFETQAWAFVPRANLCFLSSTVEGEEGGPPDFDALHAAGVLRGHASSRGVMREFCPRCGATVFWHDGERPDVVDVSAGLLRAESGALAGDWLDWWKGRVSFEEETGTGRTGPPAGRAAALVGMLREGLRVDDA